MGTVSRSNFICLGRLGPPQRGDILGQCCGAAICAALDTMDADVTRARGLAFKHFRWNNGQADVWSMSNDADALAALVRDLALPYRLSGVTTVVGIESRGFLLGAAIAVELGVGFSAIRKDGALFAGDRITEQTEPDYRGNTSKLVALRNQFAPGDRALLVDDWIETGSQAKPR